MNCYHIYLLLLNSGNLDGQVKWQKENQQQIVINVCIILFICSIRLQQYISSSSVFIAFYFVALHSTEMGI